MNWDAWTGIGTIALAVMTLAAVVTSIVLARQDRRRFEDERRSALEQEQSEEAWAVQADVMQSAWSQQGSGERLHRLVLTVSNRGRFTITRLEARFCPDGRTVMMPGRSERALPEEYHGIGSFGLVREEGAMSGILRGWGEGMQFVSEDLPDAQVKDPYALVRWTDRWGARWEHRLGGVQRVGADEEWKP